MKRKILLKNDQSPGDIMMLTAAVQALHRSHPDQFITGVDTTAKELWENNPYITDLNENDPDVEVIICKDYQLIHNSNQYPYHFIHCFSDFLEGKLGVRIKPDEFRGDIYISDDEKRWISQIEEMGIKDRFWIVMNGGKWDFTAKWSHPDYIQDVINYFSGKITFVQCGQSDHWHPPLKGCINLIGKTDIRQFIRLVYHSVGMLCPVTFGMHAAAGVPVKEGEDRPLNRACVVIAGGREPVHWEMYPHHRYLAVNGSLSCCDHGGCWKSRCTLINDDDEKNEKNTCEQPIDVNPEAKWRHKNIRGNLRIPRCMMMIEPIQIVHAIESYYKGDMMEYGSCLPDNIPENAKPFLN